MSEIERTSNFQFIWTEWVEPLIEELYGQMDKTFQEAVGAKIRDLSKLRIKAEQYYQKKRREMKRAFYGQYTAGDSENEHRMDFHKISAVLCRTMIEYKVIDFDITACDEYVESRIDRYDTDWVVKNALINFRIAFYVSVVFLFQSMLFKYHTEDEEFCKRLKDARRLDLYEGRVSKGQVQESFENSIVLDLAKRDINNRSFDYFMYAIILYQLEVHNLELLSDKK